MMNRFFCHGFRSGILFKSAASGYDIKNVKSNLTIRYQGTAMKDESSALSYPHPRKSQASQRGTQKLYSVRKSLPDLFLHDG